MKLIRTIVAAFALLSIGMPLSAQAQSFNIGPVNINLGGGGGGVGNLPPTNLDSFVYQSGMNQAIYGDEGDIDIPPIDRPKCRRVDHRARQSHARCLGC